MLPNAIVVVGASLGGIDPLRHITEALPRNCAVSIFVTMHTGAIPSVLPEILAWHGRLPVDFARDGAPIESGHIYVAPPDHHMLVEYDHIRLDRGPMVHHTRPAVDPLFTSAAEAFGDRVVGVILSGAGNDGAAGLAAIKRKGGRALVQDPQEAPQPSMPDAALAADTPECLPIGKIVRCIIEFCTQTAAPLAT
jgi:two-component system, chemotaxis family, protein-glutamate methylesterase/glutaminase